MLSWSAFAARPQVVLGLGTGGGNFRLPYHQNFNRTLSSDTTYILTSWYFVDSTFSITIPAGTLIRGDSASGGSLIISRGAKIFAQGTKELPIVFTSNKPAGTRLPGDWGGVLILGAAPTNKPTTQQIEGGFATVPGAAAEFGGTDPDDNSGVFSYVRIEFPGIAFAQDNEINGLTLGGVGRGTKLDHIQVSFANDDDYEFFGGTVDAKYLIAWRELDDTYDTDFGWDGRLQFIYTKRDPLIFDASASGSSNGFESDNEASSPYSATPRTKARISNATIVGPARDSIEANALNSKWANTAMIRRASELSIYNSVLMGWKNGINLRDTLTQRAAIDNRLEIRNTSMAAPRAQLALSSSPSTGNIAGFDVVAWYTTGTGNLGETARQGTDMGYPIEVWNLDSTNNPVPTVGSEADVAGTSYQGRLSGDAWFDSVGYRGAFDPSLPRDRQWDWGWANYSPNSYDPELAYGLTLNLIGDWNLISVPLKGISNPAKTALFPTATSAAYLYQDGYVESPSLTHGVGYWLKFSGAQSGSLAGFPDLIDTMPVAAKWNIVGSISTPILSSSIQSIPNGNITTSYFSYDGGGYTIADTIKPGLGHWVKAAAAGSIVMDGFPTLPAPKNGMNASAILKQLNSVKVVNGSGKSQRLYFGELGENRSVLAAFEMPPVPPAGAFDARFSSQRMVEELFAEGATIQLQGITYPLSVELDLNQNNSGQAELVEMLNGKVVGTQIVRNGRAVVQHAVNALVIRTVAGSPVPSEYALSQNYPNPFNPSTRFAIDVPQNSEISVTVYDILGRNIATLFNGVKAAGSYTMEWNGTNDAGIGMPSGTYLLKMTGTGFSSVHKMLLMK
jgi:hypothetical protein